MLKFYNICIYIEEEYAVYIKMFNFGIPVP